MQPLGEGKHEWAFLALLVWFSLSAETKTLLMFDRSSYRCCSSCDCICSCFQIANQFRSQNCITNEAHQTRSRWIFPFLAICFFMLNCGEEENHRTVLESAFDKAFCRNGIKMQFRMRFSYFILSRSSCFWHFQILHRLGRVCFGSVIFIVHLPLRSPCIYSFSNNFTSSIYSCSLPSLSFVVNLKNGILEKLLD